jgi:hypothetical protein
LERRRKARWGKHKSPLHAKLLRITAKPTALPNRACPSQIDITKEGSLKKQAYPCKKAPEETAGRVQEKAMQEMR